MTIRDIAEVIIPELETISTVDKIVITEIIETAEAGETLTLVIRTKRLNKITSQRRDLRNTSLIMVWQAALTSTSSKLFQSMSVETMYLTRSRLRSR